MANGKTRNILNCHAGVVVGLERCENKLMAQDKFDDNCEGCKPAILDLTTRKALPDSHPVMQRVMRIWNSLHRSDREAYHRVMCMNSRNPQDLRLVQQIVQQFK